jgi:hypothetical protein
MTSTSDTPGRRRPDPIKDPIASALRRNKRERNLPPDAACGLCGETDIEVLARRKVHRSLLEDHHVLTESCDELVVVVLCLNCHARATAVQRDAGVLVPRQKRHLLEWLPLALLSLGTFFGLLQDFCVRAAHGLVAVVGALEAAGIDWKHLPGMP